MNTRTAVMSRDSVDYSCVPARDNYEGPNTKNLPAFGVRHAQTLILFITISVGYTLRAHLSVTLVAMTKTNNVICHEKSFNHSEVNVTQGFSNLRIINDATVYNNTEIKYVISDDDNVKEFCDNGKETWSIYKTYKWTKSQTEMILFAFYLGYTTMMIPGGMIAQKFGGKMLLMIAMVTNGILSVITPWVAVSIDWKGVCACRLLQGAFQAVMLPSSHTLLGQWVPLQEKGRLTTLVYTGVPFGTVISFQLSGLLCGTPSIGWPVSYWFWGGLSFVCFVLLARFTSDSPSQHAGISREELAYIVGNRDDKRAPKKRTTPWKAILTSSAVWAVVVGHVCSIIGFMFKLTQIPLYMDKILGVEIKENGLLSSLPHISSFIMIVAFGYLSDFLLNNKHMTLINIRRLSNTIGVTFAAIIMVATSYTSSTWLATVLLMLSHGMHSAIYTGFHVNHIDLSPNFAGPLMSLSNMAANLSGLVIPVLVSNIVGDDSTNSFKWQMTFLVVAVVQIVLNMVYLFFMRVDVQPWNYYQGDDNESEDRKEMQVIRNNYSIVSTDNTDS